MADSAQMKFRLGMFVVLLAGAQIGCAAQKDPLGAEIREALGVTQNSADEHKESIERNYDPKIILKRAEGLYQRGDYIEAAGEYQHFLDLHPLHEWADYAQLKLGMSYFKLFETIDRDPEPVRKALGSFEKLLATYPRTGYEEEARKRIALCREHLGRYEFYVGRFYYKQGALPAAITRFEGLLRAYPDHPLVPDALYYLAESYAQQGDMGMAASRLEDLLTKYPDTIYREKARQRLSRLNPPAKS